jgi:hypothetical protein
MAMMAPLQFGQIVWAEVADANGIRKPRLMKRTIGDEALRHAEPRLMLW